MALADDANRVLEQCSSTNDRIRELGEADFPHGTWVSAREQTLGRGRVGRAWISEPGNLFLSYLARVENRAHWSWIPLLAGVAAFEAVLSLRPLPALRLKWPNDLWVGSRKLGGILCEGVSGPRGGFIGVGIGINCVTAPTLADRETTMLGLAKDETDQLRARLIGELNARFAELASPVGFVRIREQYEAHALFAPGSEVLWSARAEDAGIVLGLGDAGELRVRLRNDLEKSLYAEEVSPRPVRAASF